MNEPAARTQSRTFRAPSSRLATVATLPRPALITFEGVWRYWGRGAGRWAVLRDIDLEVMPGTATSITGRNGAGKTTLLRIATGMLAPDRGRVRIESLTAGESWREYHRRIGFVSAGDRGLYSRLSVRGHLEYWTRLALMRRAYRRGAVDEVLERFELGALAARRADRLSQGQRQRLRLALALVHRPRVLLLDEPANSLDADGQGLLCGAVEDLLADGGAVVWCGPEGEAEIFAFDQRLVIEAGRLRGA
jgi:ABC-type multidrug transport system ATPase subunit